ncbi:uncharacterized protein EI97DRAFT_500143 [Westerdykella ornata]|uniref:SET domain-containing protein n=1 Tax=Westerdykella ornata TaxID=318751 RepID=A0A6A6JP47_WESOR|nr:uncharacterized protein EI97DRAFT_500143 [Westerdykella ornata]KAF2277913.1 hypothetical protein EI97DRAFT_500143 [Westerdykella ornata]
MNLIAYSDSEGSDIEAPQRPPKPVAKPTAKPAFPKVVDRSKPGKIKLQLPTPTHQPKDDVDIDAEAPPAKKARTGGGAFGGFNSMLPAPKRPNVNAISAAGGGAATSGSRGIGKSLGVGVNLKTGAEPAFKREPKAEDYDENGNPVQKSSGTPLQKEDFRALLNLPPPKTEAKPETKTESAQSSSAATPDVKPAARPRFVPMSMARGKKKPHPARPASSPSNSQTVSQSPGATEASVGDPAVAEPKLPTKPKVSLFSIPADEDSVTSKPSSSGDYQPLIYDAGEEEDERIHTEIPSASNHQSSSQSHNSNTATASGARDLTDIASELNLTEAERRQLFGRKGQGPDISAANIIEFNTDQEYAHNEMLRQQGETVQHNALKSISGTGKNSLRSLLNMATTQKEALEDHFAAGRRNKREAGNKYGWKSSLWKANFTCPDPQARFSMSGNGVRLGGTEMRQYARPPSIIMPPEPQPKNGIPSEDPSIHGAGNGTGVVDSDLSATGQGFTDGAQDVSNRKGRRKQRGGKRKATRFDQAGSQDAADMTNSGNAGDPIQFQDGTAAAEESKEKEKNTHKNRKPKKKGKKAKSTGVAPTEVSISDNSLPDKVELRTYMRNGIEEQGLFATAPIRAGTRLFNERPILTQLDPPNDTLPSEARIRNIVAAFDVLPPAERHRFMELRPGSVLQLLWLSREADYLIECYKSLRLKADSRSKEEDVIYNALGSRLFALCRSWRIAARFHANSWKWSVQAGHGSDGSPEYELGTAAFVNICRINHSCIPNCFPYDNPETGRMTVHATCDIAPGEQLFHSAQGTAHWYHTAANRARDLRWIMGIHCTCPACDATHPDFGRHENIRGMLGSHSFKVSEFFNVVKHCDENGFIVRNIDGKVEKQGLHLEVEAFVKMEEIITDMFWLLDSLGCGDLEMPRWRKGLREFVFKRLKKWYAVQAHANKELLETARCIGEDHPHYRSLKEDIDFTIKCAKLEIVKEEIEQRESREEERRLNASITRTTIWILQNLQGRVE